MEIDFPPCFKSKERYLAWEEGNTQGVSYCYDCTPQFQARANRLNLCTYPSVVFVDTLDDDKEPVTVGVRSAL